MTLTKLKKCLQRLDFWRCWFRLEKHSEFVICQLHTCTVDSWLNPRNWVLAWNKKSTVFTAIFNFITNIKKQFSKLINITEFTDHYRFGQNPDQYPDNAWSESSRSQPGTVAGTRLQQLSYSQLQISAAASGCCCCRRRHTDLLCEYWSGAEFLMNIQQEQRSRLSSGSPCLVQWIWCQTK